MFIRAKFKVQSITDNGYNTQAKLTAVCGKEGENAGFSKATPSGDMNITIDKGTPAAEFFKPQQCVYLDITEAPAS